MKSAAKTLLLGSLCAGAVSADGTCSSVSGMIIGQGFIDEKSHIASAGDCCQACHDNSNCIAYTYDTQTQGCFLKDNILGNTTQGSRVSGVVAGRKPADHWNACHGTSAALPFCNEDLSLDERVQDLVKRIELGEIGDELTARQSAEIPRLGLPAYYWGTNAIHGMQNVQCIGNLCPTTFPAPCAMAASFNMENVEIMGQIIGVEERGYYNAQAHDSLDTWSPTINLNRDPRWGRNVESAGEDPLLCGMFGGAYAKGLQQEGKDKYLQAVVTLKHWMSYTLENYHGVTRHNVDSKVSAWDMVHNYLPQWEVAVKENGAKGVMCSYNMVNGKPTCGNKMLTDILRNDFNFTGYITSDSDSCADIYTSHKYVKTGEEAVRECLMSGTDIDSGGTYHKYLASAINKSVVDKKYADRALYNSYKMRFELGLFDVKGAKESKYASITKEVVGQASHKAASLKASREVLVLLKNDGVLPAKKGLKVAVIGQAANDTGALLGNYNGPICVNGKTDCYPTIFQEVSRVNGGSTTLETDLDTTKSVAAAQAADFVVIVVDNAKDGGGEGHDRDTISLSASQLAMAQAVIALKKPTVLVLVNGGIIAIDDLKDSSPAILEAFMPGVFGGQAIAETIFGDNNPGGKMPVTMYHSSIVNEVDFYNMSMVAGPGRSYKFYTGTPLFPFGFGLSYTTFSLSGDVPKVTNLDSAGSVTLSVTLKNTGTVAGDEVIFAHMTNESKVRVDTPMPIKSLLAFQRVHLSPGETKTVPLLVEAKRMHLVDAKGVKKVIPGQYDIQVDRGHGDVMKFPISVTGDAKTLFELKPWWTETTDTDPSPVII